MTSYCGKYFLLLSAEKVILWQFNDCVMRDQKIRYPLRFALLFSVINLVFLPFVFGQVSSVEFGKNRLQFKKMKWQYYQTPNFNCYYYTGGEQLAKYVLQVAEEEVPSLEKFTE